MPQQLSTAVENNFSKGLITEATGLNFPENAATETYNCIYDIIGNVTRRQGIDYEANYALTTIAANNVSISTYKWDNAGGDGNTKLLVQQVDNTLFFYLASAAIAGSPLSTKLIPSGVDISTFVANGVLFNGRNECDYASGNGYLIVYHPNCDPFYCVYSGGVVTATRINVKFRDFQGIIEPGVPVDQRSNNISNEHLYNLINQGWTQGPSWIGRSGSGFTPSVGLKTFTITNGTLPATVGTTVQCISPPNFGYNNPSCTFTGVITAYSGTSMTINVYAYNSDALSYMVYNNWTITPTSIGYISTWASGIGNYPSNADVWWRFKNSSNVFDPVVQLNNVTLSNAPAPKGHFILDAFNQNLVLASAISTLTNVSTTARPATGCWFQGRTWYAGVNGSFAATGDAIYTTWTENIYFSQIINDPTMFGNCYQTNDPTSEELFDLLPTDGGVIKIQGCGSVYKLFPIQNGLLVFAANGVWFITGSQGIGFTANDYTVTKISSVKSISSKSFVDVTGLPYFWNEDGIYCVQPQKGGGLAVEPITVGTILSFYQDIPFESKIYARAAYDPVNYNIQWVYRSTLESGINNRYRFDSILNYCTYNKAFYPHRITSDTPHICSIQYIETTPGNGLLPMFKYLTTTDNIFTFSDEHDEDYVDFKSYNNIGVDFTSYFVTGFKLRGQGIKKFQPQYIQIYSRQDEEATGYRFQGIWDYANSRSSGKWSSIQEVINGLSRFDIVSRRHKVRGNGYTLQFKLQSVSGMGFDIQGWAVIDSTNSGA